MSKTLCSTHLPSTQSDRRRAELHRERQRRLLVVLRLRPLLLFPGARGRLRPAQAQVKADAQQSEPQPNNLSFDLNILMRVSKCPPSPPPQVDCGRRGPSKASSPHCTRSKALSRSLMLWAPTRAFLLPSLITRWDGSHFCRFGNMLLVRDAQKPDARRRLTLRCVK